LASWEITGTGEQIAHHGCQDNDETQKGGDGGGVVGLHDSAQADLGENALAGEQFGGQSDHKPNHGQSAIPGFGKSDEAETGRIATTRTSRLSTAL
jgi:hypothetical protein